MKKDLKEMLIEKVMQVFADEGVDDVEARRVISATWGRYTDKLRKDGKLQRYEKKGDNPSS